MKSTKHFKRVVDNKMKWFGETDLNKNVIRVNKKKSKTVGKGELLDTIHHEELHAKHPNMHERTVRKLTRAMLPTLSAKKKQEYYRKYT